MILPNINQKYEKTVYHDKLEPKQYYDYMSQSRITISPYGLGERVKDDNTAIFFDTIVIKPNCDYIYDYFNTFTDKKFNSNHKIQFDNYIVYCKPDYSDILEVIDNIFDNYDYHMQQLQKLKTQYFNFLKTDNYENDFKEVMMKIVNS